MSDFNMQQLLSAKIKLMKNIEELLEEACLLKENNRIARAYFLTDIALEEMAKIPMITRLIDYMLMSKALPYSWKSFKQRFRDHQHKIYASQALGYFISDEEPQNRYTLNKLKNNSLYVDITKEGVSMPSDAIKLGQLEQLYGKAVTLFTIMKHTEEQYLENTKDHNYIKEIKIRHELLDTIFSIEHDS